MALTPCFGNLDGDSLLRIANDLAATATVKLSLMEQFHDLRRRHVLQPRNFVAVLGSFFWFICAVLFFVGVFHVKTSGFVRVIVRIFGGFVVRVMVMLSAFMAVDGVDVVLRTLVLAGTARFIVMVCHMNGMGWTVFLYDFVNRHVRNIVATLVLAAGFIFFA
jgi:hypothetical protein